MVYEIIKYQKWQANKKLNSKIGSDYLFQCPTEKNILMIVCFFDGGIR